MVKHGGLIMKTLRDHFADFWEMHDNCFTKDNRNDIHETVEGNDLSFKGSQVLPIHPYSTFQTYGKMTLGRKGSV
ncbi:hypothetical protein [Salipaludibacillus daqingensis]|uniref:hypothetical protein n=1 Tax=Salipaludibacillus daqingensis TaxID=3041001 RepID=UPI002473594D|nr:hypothetical protein [Salipaludibacillus daqingensis]